MATGAQFSVDLRRIIERANGRVDLVVRKVALDLFSRVIMSTPVDTGRARGGWVVSVGSPTLAAPVRTDKAGTDTEREMMAAVPPKPAGLSIFLTNNVNYIRYLEYGAEIGARGSPQAPNGMVRVAVQQFVDVLNRALAETQRDGR